MSTTASAGTENCLEIGTRLSDFEITGVLGEGGFGIVYIAFDHALQRTVAIKEYMPGALAARAADQSVTMRAERHRDTFNVGLKSFINEARFLAQFDHPALVKVYRFWEQNQTAYTAMQYYDGRTIKDIVAGTPGVVTEAWCLQVFRQILDALETLYTMQILHRDISPDNIIVHDNGDAVLLDFGSARQIIGDMTKGLTVILKPGYAPVEQYAGDASLEQGAYTDIYALCAVMYFAIVKEPPPTSIARMIKDPLGPLAERGMPGYSSGFLHALDKGLAVLAADRPQTIDAFRALLGIASGTAPRARVSGTTQRFATVDRVPETAPAAPSAGADAAKPATPAARPAFPRRLGGIVAVGVICAGIALTWLLGRSSDPVMVAPGAGPALADASAIPAAPSEPLAQATAEPAAEVLAEPASKSVETAVQAPAAAEKVVQAAPETASYKVLIKPWGTVFVDGKERGVSPPLKRLVLPAGKHQIRIVNPGFPDHTMEVNLSKNTSGTIEHDFAAASK